jgi:serine/threonine-protein kinase
LDGSTLNNRFEIVRSIGHGGAAIVYLGRDLLLNRQVAIKILRAQHAADPGYVERFRREAQAAASFAHPNIVDIYDVGEFNGAPYIVMEFIQGDTLAEIINTEGPFDPDDVAALIEQVAAGLDYAHARGIIHRDVKPHNILVTREGLAKIVDFGIARSTGESSLTDAGLTLGTAHYISPEQASGLSATPASDVYSLGVIAYEMLAGVRPFDGETAVAVATMHVNQAAVPPDEIDPEVPPGAADIVLKSLEKDPTRRYPSAGAFAEALANWRTSGIPPKGMVTRAMPPIAPGRQSERRPPRPSTAGLRSAEHPTAERTAPIPNVSPKPAAPLSFDEDFSAPLEPIARARSGNGTLWAGFFVVAALALIVWIGGRVAGSDGDSQPSTQVPTPTTMQNPAGFASATSTPQITTVPNLVGLSQQVAASSARTSGLKIEIVERRADEEADTGTVIEQVPAADESANAGDTIQVVLSAGSRKIDLASLNLSGLPVEEAAALITQAGLTPIIEETGSPDVDRGNVVRTEPEQEADPASNVTIFVSVGDQVWVDPTLQGQPLDTVVQALTDAGLVVINQNPVSATQIDEVGIDREAFGIVDQDVVGIQDNGAEFAVWLPRGTEVSLNYFDEQLEAGD